MTGEDDELARLRTRVANLERMAERLAHELATPLTTAQGFAQILLDDDGLSAEVRDGLKRVERASRQALQLLQHRVDEGIGDGLRSMRLRELVRDAVTSVLGVAATAGRALPAEARVFGDPVGMRRALVLVLEAMVPADGMSAPDEVEVVLAQERASALQLRITRGERDASEDDLDVRLAEAASVLAGLGGRLWIDHPGAAAGRRAVLVELQRDVVT